MPTIWGIRDGYSLRPYMKFMDALEEIPEGERLRIKIEKDRNGKFSALFHVMLGMIASAISDGPGPTRTSRDELKRWIKIKKGYYDVVDLPTPTLTGETKAVEYQSVAFNKMGEEEFHKFVCDACELIRAELVSWIDQSPQWAEIHEILSSIMPEQAA